MISIVLLMIFWHDDYRVPAVASEMVHSSWIYSGRKTSLDLSFEVDHHLQLNFGVFKAMGAIVLFSVCFNL